MAISVHNRTLTVWPYANTLKEDDWRNDPAPPGAPPDKLVTMMMMPSSNADHERSVPSLVRANFVVTHHEDFFFSSSFFLTAGRVNALLTPPSTDFQCPTSLYWFHVKTPTHGWTL